LENTTFLHPLTTPNRSQRRENDFQGTPEIKKTGHPTKDVGYSVAQRMNTAKWQTCRKLETGRGRNVNAAVDREETCKIKKGRRRNNTFYTEELTTFQELQACFTKEESIFSR
jgi:hypothetical protein